MFLFRFVIERESAHRETEEKEGEKKVEEEERVTVGKLSLPSKVFASHQEEEVGLLNRAAPRYCTSVHQQSWTLDNTAATTSPCFHFSGYCIIVLCLYSL